MDRALRIYVRTTEMSWSFSYLVWSELKLYGWWTCTIGNCETAHYRVRRRYLSFLYEPFRLCWRADKLKQFSVDTRIRGTRLKMCTRRIISRERVSWSRHRHVYEYVHLHMKRSRSSRNYRHYLTKYPLSACLQYVFEWMRRERWKGFGMRACADCWRSIYARRQNTGRLSIRE